MGHNFDEGAENYAGEVNLSVLMGNEFHRGRREGVCGAEKEGRPPKRPDNEPL
jgi:hypothetical protein